MRVDTTSSTGQGVSNGCGREQVEDTIAVAQPAAIEPPALARREGPARQPKSLVQSCSRPRVCRVPALFEVPAEFGDGARRKAHRELVARHCSGGRGEAGGIRADEQPKRPSGQGRQQLGMPCGEGAKVVIEGRGCHVEEHDTANRFDRDRQLLGKEPDACRRACPDRDVRQVLAG